ncbi:MULTISPECIES: type 1 glutamine amidotransferase domain-containing protein [Pseudoalteromonas]|uniref:Type 1 glutamine amidotransferase domain-containing protein n=1 Tax=Pseudoalteromonas obscura TaxID=3048491 RepID=A0ABT7EFD2_9GAMM|nr:MULTISPECIES: type 1 glutamine amidotransferase domain-containing protein [Pseudoalteromonas]MBQ4835753.1 type 1 glutamine amidotransferase domain-containing protein [Pseudoalteromonas luteoviolacea]MDK2593996.1 type 1 glutamine amidotransferase domain-containing protein [Pseudoalteromonas sp. P94(2023)]
MFKVIGLLWFVLLGTFTEQALAKMSNSEKVLFILSADKHGYYLPEVVEPYQHIMNNGYTVEFASPDGSPGRPVAYNLLSKQAQVDYKIMRKGSNIDQPKPLKSIQPKDYVAFYVPGGAGPMFDLAGHPEMARLSLAFLAQDKIISAVCHGPAAFVDIKNADGTYLVSGLKVTAKSNAEEGRWARKNYAFLLQDKLKAQGAKFAYAAPGEPYVIHDNGVLTGQNPKSALPTAIVLVELLKQGRS